MNQYIYTVHGMTHPGKGYNYVDHQSFMRKKK